MKNSTNNKEASFIPVSEKMKDMEFKDFQKWGLSKIMAVYGMQPIVLGVIDPTTGKLNSAEQRAQFKSDAILPLLNLESYHLNDVLVRKGFGFDDVEIGYEEPQIEDREDISRVIERVTKSGVITINEAREMLGLPAIDGGDRLPLHLELSNLRSEMDKSEKLDRIEEIRQRITALLEEDNEATEKASEEDGNEGS